jgi:hypothetical protein
MKKPIHLRFTLSMATVAALLCATKLTAQSTLITFSVDMATNIANGTFVQGGADTVEVQGTLNGWTSGDTLVQEGSGTVYTNTFNDTSDANGNKVQYKFVMQPANSYENTASGQNRCALLPANSGASLVLPTPFFSDDGAAVTNEVTFNVDVSEQIVLGDFTPGSSYVEVRGLFNGWAGGVDEMTNDPNILVTNEQYGVITSNVWVGTFPVVASPAAAEAFKYVIQPGTDWESPDAVDQDGGQNRFFSNVPGTLPLVSFSDEAYSPSVSSITFNVDMSVITAEDPQFNPATLALWGNFNGWSTGVAVTNSSANTNIYSCTISYAQGETLDYQFRYDELNTGNTVYDNLDGIDGSHANRVIVVPTTATNIPAAMFNDAEFDDYLPGPIAVTFTVDMTYATETNLYFNDYDYGPFNPATDNVYVNGEFGPTYANWYTWSGSASTGYATAPPGFQMIEEGSSLIYTNTVVLSYGTPVSFQYQYGTDPGSQFGGPVTDEPVNGINHQRVVRITSTGAYTLPTDQFGNPYEEPVINLIDTTGAELTVSSPIGGQVPVTWLGRPGAKLQSTTNVIGSWQTIAATDGTNWTTGFNSTNGFVSETNWPATQATFFRVIKQ